MGEVTRLLDQARGGDADAWDQVVALLYGDLLQVARRARAGHRVATLNATALVNECYLRMARQQADAINNRAHFLAVAGCAMRQVLVNYARDRVAAKRGGGALHVTLNEITMRADEEAEDLLALNDAMTQLASKDMRLARVVDCRVFAGLSEAETAAALDLSLRSVQRYWHAAREHLCNLLED